MDIDQETPLPAGWAFGKNSIKAHYFKSGHFTSLCGKCVANNARIRNDRAPITADCLQCQREWKAEREPSKND